MRPCPRCRSTKIHTRQTADGFYVAACFECGWSTPPHARPSHALLAWDMNAEEHRHSPCPFCRVMDLHVVDVASTTDRKAIGCTHCGAIGPDAPTVPLAFVRWNDRGSQQQRAAERAQVAHEL